MPTPTTRSPRPTPHVPPAAPPPSARPATFYPDEIIERIVAHVHAPDDFLRVMAIDRQWRRAALRPNILAGCLRGVHVGAADGLAPRSFHRELLQQVQAAQRLRRGNPRTVDCRLPRDASLLQLARNRYDGDFLLGQQPLGQLLMWPLASIGQSQPARIANHRGALSCVGISADGAHIASASSPLSLRGGAGGGALQLWRRAACRTPRVLEANLRDHISALAVAAHGQAVVAYLPAVGQAQIRLWVLAADGGVSAPLTLSCSALGHPKASMSTFVAAACGREGAMLARPPAVRLQLSAALGDMVQPRREERPGGSAPPLSLTPKLEALLRASVEHMPGSPGGPEARASTQVGTSVGESRRIYGAMGHSPQQAQRLSLLQTGQHKWRGAIFSPCGKLLLSRTSDGDARLFYFFSQSSARATHKASRAERIHARAASADALYRRSKRLCRPSESDTPGKLTHHPTPAAL